MENINLKSPEALAIQVVSFYKFFPIPESQVEMAKDALYGIAHLIDRLADKPLTCRGLCILGTEGLNGTFSMPREYANEFKTRVSQAFNQNDIWFKDTFANNHVFHDFKVKVRNEIVTLERTDIVPKGSHHHLSPEEWNKVMREDDPVIIDTRNSYEYEIGHFKGAIDPKIEEFNEFPEWLRKANIPKDKKVLIYCTGGIRCEKAIFEMHDQGFENVYQLDGGIINYLKEKPNSEFDGECFVFDYRIAVDQNLMPTKNYKLCPHCGLPAKTQINCVQCGVEEVVCDACIALGDEFKTCSKNCAHHKRMGHKSKRIHHDAFNKRVIE